MLLIEAITINDESLEWLMFGKLAFEERWQKKVGRRNFGKFTVHPIVNNITVTNWRIKVWKISSIHQICQTKVTPNLRYVNDITLYDVTLHHKR